MNKTKNFLLEVIHNSDVIKNKITNYDRNELIEAINFLSDKEIDSLFKILEKTDLHLDRHLDKTMITTAVVAPGGIGIYAIYKLLTMYNYKCGIHCRNKKDELDKKLCYKLCDVQSIEKTIKDVKSELNDCWYSKNSKKCRKSTISYLQNLYDRLEKSKIKLINYQFKIKERNKKNAKL